MATWAIGDIQGCWQTLQALLARIEFTPGRDRLWLVGDLVNRGTGSLAVLRWAVANQNSVVAVLGNHELGLLSCAYGVRKPKKRDTIGDILAAPDRDELLTWVRGLPVLHQDAAIRPDTAFVMVHAGVLPGWTIATAAARAAELERVLRGPNLVETLASWRGDSGKRAVKSGLRRDPADRPRGAPWGCVEPDVDAPDRAAFLMNAYTRMRCLDAAGALDLAYAGDPADRPKHLQPWYERAPMQPPHHLLFGHWAALGAVHGAGWTAVDSGCVWGNSLSALCLETLALVQVDTVRADIAPVNIETGSHIP